LLAGRQQETQPRRLLLAQLMAASLAPTWEALRRMAGRHCPQIHLQVFRWEICQIPRALARRQEIQAYQIFHHNLAQQEVDAQRRPLLREAHQLTPFLAHLPQAAQIQAQTGQRLQQKHNHR
jgi:hypothetical protein